MGHTETLLRNWYRPGWWANSAIPLVCRRLNRSYYELTRGESCPLMAEDWDNLILLDGCRYDLFADTVEIDGTLTSKRSLGSATPEFLRSNFAERNYHDTVYVTANPMYQREGLDGTFHATVDVWKDHWSDEHQTVRPGPMVEATRRAYDEYPDKRILSHFMQPHYPFIGELGRELGEHAGFEWTYREVTDGDRSRDAPTVWQQLEAGAVSREAVWAAYRENLELAMPHVRELVTYFDETTVVTSDHGNMLGEYTTPIPMRIYGHPPGTYTDELLKVPWLVIEGDSRKQRQAEPPADAAEESHSEQVTERLADLGYVEQ